MKDIIRGLKEKAQGIKNELVVLYMAYKHPGTPLHAKLFTALVIGYALSPIDLIPDFIPVLGYLDDLILIPAGIALAIKMIPKDVMSECRAQAADMNRKSLGKSWLAAGLILLIWIIIIAAVARNFI